MPSKLKKYKGLRTTWSQSQTNSTIFRAVSTLKLSKSCLQNQWLQGIWKIRLARRIYPKIQVVPLSSIMPSSPSTTWMVRSAVLLTTRSISKWKTRSNLSQKYPRMEVYHTRQIWSLDVNKKRLTLMIDQVRAWMKIKRLEKKILRGRKSTLRTQKRSISIYSKVSTVWTNSANMIQSRSS